MSYCNNLPSCSASTVFHDRSELEIDPYLLRACIGSGNGPGVPPLTFIPYGTPSAPTPSPTPTATRTPTWTTTPGGPTPTPTRTPTPGGPTLTPTPTPTPAPGGPPVPTGVSASDGAFTDRVRVTWNAPAGTTGYWVYRNTTASPPASEMAWVGSPGYVDSAAVPGQNYWYWVRAGNVSAWSTYSAYDTGFRAIGPVPTPTRTPTPPAGLTASFAFAPGAPFAGATVQFTDTSTGASAWDWSFGDGTRSSARNPVHTYAARGTYTVVLWVSNGVGSSQTTKTITVGARARRNSSGR